MLKTAKRAEPEELFFEHEQLVHGIKFQGRYKSNPDDFLHRMRGIVLGKSFSLRTLNVI